MKNNVALEKSENFSMKIIDLYEDLSRTRMPQVLLTQILKSGTSIGANLNEGVYAISEKDFLNKVYISLKECSETLYWLRLLNKASYLGDERFAVLYTEGEEILKILTATTKTMSKKLTL